MLASAKRKRQGPAKPTGKRMKKTLFIKTPPDVRSAGEIPSPDVATERHAKNAGNKDPALPVVVDVMMDDVEGPAPDIVADASINNEVPVHYLSSFVKFSLVKTNYE